LRRHKREKTNIGHFPDYIRYRSERVLYYEGSDLEIDSCLNNKDEVRPRNNILLTLLVFLLAQSIATAPPREIPYSIFDVSMSGINRLRVTDSLTIGSFDKIFSPMI